MNILLSSIDIAANTYLRTDNSGLIKASAEKMLEKLPGICYNTAKYEKDPGSKDIDEIRYRILGPLYKNIRIFYPLCQNARRAGISTKELISISEGVKSWTEWRLRIERAIESQEKGNV